MKYPLIALLGLFAILMLVSFAHEKPRQFRVAKNPESQINGQEMASTPVTPNSEASGPSPAPGEAARAPAPSGGSQASAKPAPVRPQSIVVAYSKNEVGGKIVLTGEGCEKRAGHSAYTTHPDGNIDFGCWTFDELYILIYWDKAGLIHYGYDKFVHMQSGERLLAAQLFEATRDAARAGRPLTPPSKK